ncbi:sensor domain-containing diguanylate cyclase [Acidaminobacter sp. JC074]|uniref:sensor domain-containing diguanylate cyclase n=1 Tax=Acidaminobacter sp. JC074 TaxID=2530199 RepID=UPI001F111CFE|nr:sensor domain-containing diguanylate cyclase [Acidaminobacter sp. JC074]MCH4889734.1 sensor domain-containing diguanylate cyclase [Acidaminobacter sp. JC074]
MNLDELILKLNQTRIKSYTDDSKGKILNVLNKSGIGVFEWYYNELDFYANDRVLELIKSDQVNFLLEGVQKAFEDKEKFTVLNHFMKLFEGEDLVVFERPFFNNKVWYKLSFSRDKSKAVITGVIENITSLKSAQEDVKGLSSQLEQFLDIIPLPMYYYDTVGNLMFTNQFHSADLSRINKIIEKYVHDQLLNIDDYEWIKSLSIEQYSDHHMKMKVTYFLRHKLHVNIIHRVKIKDDSNAVGILYLHEDVTNYQTDNSQLNKILKANELVIEIKDIVDHANDLTKMYDYLLEKINTVIPAAKRACILKINSNDDLYIDADYGFEKSYIEDMVIPFKKSYAARHLAGNYDKSIIIDEIDKKYLDLLPDGTKLEAEFILRSNITTPLVINGSLYGILSVDSDTSHVFDDVDLNLLDYIKIQIERAIVKFKNMRKVKRDSIIDPLTGIFNRRHLVDLFDTYVMDANELAKSFVLVLFDLDKLKKVNDSYGHVAGDQVIKQFAFVIENEIRDSDVIARIGGDEFVGIFWDIEEKHILNRLENWKDLFDTHPISYEGNTIITKFSYGIASYPKHKVGFEELLNIADKEMYAQKKKKS